MKKIFDWMREEISDHLNHCRKMEAQSRTKFEEFGYGSRVDAYNRAIEYINEAEAKWEADCCEWELEDAEANLYVTKCEQRQLIFDGTPTDNDYKYCPYCGRRIVEVE